MLAMAPAHYIKGPDLFEKLLIGFVLILFSFTVAAILKGRREWGSIDPLIWLHLGTLMLALLLTPLLLFQKRGTLIHRRLGWLWAASMFLTALMSLGISQAANGRFSPIHILSVAVLLGVPALILRARRHEIIAHRQSARALVSGALLAAGFFTFPFDRLLGHWLFG